MAIPKNLRDKVKEYEESRGKGDYIKPEKLEDGMYRMRILSPLFYYYEGWINSSGGKKPYRFDFDDDPDNHRDVEWAIGDYGPQRPKVFISFIVLIISYKPINGETEEVNQIGLFSIGQASLQKALYQFEENEDGETGDTRMYDLKFTKNGKAKNKNEIYGLAPLLKSTKPVHPSLIEEANAMKIHLPALVSNDNPFGHDDADLIDPAMFSGEGDSNSFSDDEDDYASEDEIDTTPEAGWWKKVKTPSGVKIGDMDLSSIGEAVDKIEGSEKLKSKYANELKALKAAESELSKSKPKARPATDDDDEDDIPF